MNHHYRVQPRILVLTASSLPSTEYVSRMRLLDNALNKECYASLHGYDFVFDTTDYVNGSQMRFGWNKVFSVRRHLEHYDWVLWMDTDQWFNAMTRPVTQFLTEFALHGTDAHIVVPSDHPEENRWAFSNSIFLVRNSLTGRKFVDSWLAFGTGARPLPCGWPQLLGGFMDQGWMWIALLETLANSTKKPSKCLASCPGSDSVVDCLGMDLDSRYSKGHAGLSLEKVRGPVVFNSFMKNDVGQPDVGLDVNLNLRRQWQSSVPPELKDIEWTALSWHLKPNKPIFMVYEKRLNAVQEWCISHLQCRRLWDGKLTSPITASCQTDNTILKSVVGGPV